jgi:hypothetical protein
MNLYKNRYFLFIVIYCVFLFFSCLYLDRMCEYSVNDRYDSGIYSYPTPKCFEMYSILLYSALGVAAFGTISRLRSSLKLTADDL